MTLHSRHARLQPGELRNTFSPTPTRSVVPAMFRNIGTNWMRTRPRLRHFGPIVCVVPALFLSACESDADKARSREKIMQESGASQAELCPARQAIARAELDAGNAEAYRFEKMIADQTCLNAELCARNGTCGDGAIGLPDDARP